MPDIICLNLELLWTIHVVSKLNETRHSLWNLRPQFENLMFTVVIISPKLEAILSHNYEDKIIKTCKIKGISQHKLHKSDSVSAFLSRYKSGFLSDRGSYYRI